MTFELSIPKIDGSTFDIALPIGERLFVLGANGCGKSSLMHRINGQHKKDARWISAHRQTWLQSNAITLSPGQRLESEVNIRNNDANEIARWQDQNSAERVSMALYDLLDADNTRNRQIATAFEANDTDLARKLALENAPVKAINEILKQSNMPVQMSLRGNAEFVATKLGSEEYSVAQLSDGERNSLLIAGTVLTVKGGTLLLIDEPERHLHRSIISPLLTLLFSKRRDCAFVISTHDVSLPLDDPKARTLLVRDCKYERKKAAQWDVDLMASHHGIGEELKRDILGSRRIILFVEGREQQSLDKPLYSLLFPNVSVVAKSTCRDVEHAVSGIRDADDVHWVHAFGIVDNDLRSQSGIDELKAKNVYALPSYSVESIYFHPDVQLRAAKRQADVTGDNVDLRVAEAKSAGLAAIGEHAERLSERTAEKAVRERCFESLPKKKHLSDRIPVSVSICVECYVERERDRLQAYLETNDLLAILQRYPVRETPALDRMATKLGFKDRTQYEGAVRKMLMDDQEALAFVLSHFGSLGADLKAAQASRTAPIPVRSQ